MSIGKKYNIDEEKITNLVKDGVIGWGEVRKDQILSIYQREIDAGTPKPEAIKRVSDQVNVTSSYVYRIVNRINKKC